MTKVTYNRNHLIWLTVFQGLSSQMWNEGTETGTAERPHLKEAGGREGTLCKMPVL